MISWSSQNINRAQRIHNIENQQEKKTTKHFSPINLASTCVHRVNLPKYYENEVNDDDDDDKDDDDNNEMKPILCYKKNRKLLLIY